jgi:hypothetical protein
MAKLTRVYQKLFGVNGGAIGVFGSAQANSPANGTLTNDPATVQSLAAYEAGWASASIGGTRRPTQEEFNGINFVNTRQLAYLFQEGIAVWDSSTEYHENSLVKEDGTTNIYKSITNTNIGNALTDTNNWELLTGLRSEQNKVVINKLSDFPAPVANVITLEDGKDYRISGSVNIGINRIVFGDNCGLTGDNPQNDILVYEGTGNMLTVINNNLILIRLGISCDAGTLFDATDIDYTIDPSVDPFQGRSKRFYVFNCNLIGGVAGNGSNIGEVEGFGTINFNSNLVRGWDSGLQVSNGLSFEGLNNKVVLWNGQGATMVTFRDNNWSGQTGGVGSYIPTGFNALNFNGNTLHPRTIDYAISIEEGSSARSANIAGNIFISTGITTGGIFNPNSLGYNDLPTYNIQGNQGIADNTPKIQLTIDNFTGATTALTANVPAKLNFNNTVKTSKNLLFSSRILVTSAANFEVGQIITGGTSTYTAKIESIDLPNNYIYVEYVQDGAGDNQYFTIGETITSATASTTYNGVDGTLKYYGDKPISSRILSTLTLIKSQAGADVFRLILRINGINDDMTSAYIELDSGIPLQIVLQALEDLEKDDIIEIYVENTGSGDDVVCESIVWNITSS